MDTTATAGQIIKNLAVGAFANLGKVLPSGALEARRLKNGEIRLYWRYTLGGKTKRATIGAYDASAPPKSLKPTARRYSILAAFRAAEGLAQKHHDNLPTGGYSAIVEAEKSARRAIIAAKQEIQQQTLSALLGDYCAHLKALGRSSYKDALSIFNLHVIAAWPTIAGMPAAEVTTENIADMMRMLLDNGKGRTANKLRAYMRAAFQTAKAARTKASIPVRFKAYKILVNPAAETEPDESQNVPDKNPLTSGEMRTYWHAIKAIEGVRGAILRLHILTGAQRIEQLVNLLTANVGDDAILLHDGKGRPGRPPRPHFVPLTDAAHTALLNCGPSGKFALSTDGGETHIAATTLSAWAVDAVGDKIRDFKAKRIRSGVETLLASVGISQEVRGRLQSHGISGVQARHYDGHDYMAEKRKALEVLAEMLEQAPASNIVKLKRKKTAA